MITNFAESNELISMYLKKLLLIWFDKTKIDNGIQYLTAI